jgi:hypothetical protein
MFRVTYDGWVDHLGNAQVPRRSLYQIPDSRFQVFETRNNVLYRLGMIRRSERLSCIARDLDCSTADGHHETMSTSRSRGNNDLMSGRVVRFIMSSFPMKYRGAL